VAGGTTWLDEPDYLRALGESRTMPRGRSGLDHERGFFCPAGGTFSDAAGLIAVKPATTHNHLQKVR
jgi:hypothetical protein